MLILFHVIIALVSLAFTGFTFFTPSKTKLRISQVLIALTLGSGTFLVFSTHANMVSSCLSGLAYLSVVSAGIFAASKKLAAENFKE